MKIDLTITISVILALAAIISPIIVSAMNNRSQLKIKKMENYELAKRNAFEKFAKDIGSYISYHSTANKIDLGNSLYGLLPYFKIDLYLLNNILDKNPNDISEDVYSILKIIREQL